MKPLLHWLATCALFFASLPPKPIIVVPAHRLKLPPMVVIPPIQPQSVVSSIASEYAPDPIPEPTPPPTPTIMPTSVPVGASVQWIKDTIAKWANHYGVSSDWLLRVAKCESGYQQYVVNHHYYAGGGNPSGIFQFLPQTFARNAARIGIVNQNIWDVEQQAQVAAWMFSIGQSTQWECK